MRLALALSLVSCALAGTALAQTGGGEFPPCGPTAPAAAGADFSPEGPARVLPLSGLEPRLGALLARGVEAGSLALAVAAAPLPGAAPGVEAAVAVVEIAAGPLFESHPGGCLGLEVALLAVDGGGRVVASRHDGVGIDTAAGGGPSAAGLRYLARLELPPGTISLRALARVPRTGAFALASTRFTLPGPPLSGATAPAGERWIEALAPGLDPAQVAALAAAGTLPRPFAGRAGTTGAPDAAAPVAAAPAPPAARELEDLSVLVDGHLAALRTLGAGQPQEALARLEGLDLAALAADPEDALDRLARARERVLAAFEPSQRRALLPVALLYSDLRRAHLSARRGALAQRADEAARRALERFLELSPAREERTLAAAVLDGLAVDDLRHGDPSRAIQLLARAADLDPERAERWLALAVLYERDWRLDAAERATELVLALRPGHREALLRAARVARARGAAERAAARLATLLARPEPDWIHAVAVEERARLDFDAGRFELAAARLEEAAAQLPEEAPIAAALAFARFRGGNRPGAFAAAARAAEAGRAGRTAPRRLYCEPPLALLLQSRATAEAEALLRLDALARAVSRIESRR